MTEIIALYWAMWAVHEKIAYEVLSGIPYVLLGFVLARISRG